MKYFNPQSDSQKNIPKERSSRNAAVAQDH